MEINMNTPATPHPALPVCHVTIHPAPASGNKLIVECPERNGGIREFARDAHGELFQKALGSPVASTVGSIKYRFTQWGKRYGCKFEFCVVAH